MRPGANGPCTERQPLCDAGMFGVYIKSTTSKGSGEIGAPGESCQALTRRAWATVSSNSSRTSPGSLERLPQSIWSRPGWCGGSALVSLLDASRS